MHKFDLSVMVFCFIIISILIFLKIKLIINNDTDNINNKIKNILDNNKEDFIVADAEDFHNYNILRANIKKESDTFDDEPKNESKSVNGDKKEEGEYSITVKYNNPKLVPEKKEPKSFITAVDFGWDNPFPIVSCANSSIDERYKTGPKKLLPYQIACGYPNKLTGENFYKTHFMAQAANLEDYAVRGANYMEYSGFTHPTKLNVNILSQNTKGLPPDQSKYKNIPSGFNYAFYNTPAMRMP